MARRPLSPVRGDAMPGRKCFLMPDERCAPFAISRCRDSAAICYAPDAMVPACRRVIELYRPGRHALAMSAADERWRCRYRRFLATWPPSPVVLGAASPALCAAPRFRCRRAACEVEHAVAARLFSHFALCAKQPAVARHARPLLKLARRPTENNFARHRVSASGTSLHTRKYRRLNGAVLFLLAACHTEKKAMKIYGWSSRFSLREAMPL